MIINKITKAFQTRSDKPRTNWLGDDWYLVPDNSLLADKIQILYPRFDFVLDENDNLIDVIEVQKSEEELIQEQIEEIDAELSSIDSQGVTRHLENQVEASGTYETLYEATKTLIDRKKELRVQRLDLINKLNK